MCSAIFGDFWELIPEILFLDGIAERQTWPFSHNQARMVVELTPWQPFEGLGQRVAGVHQANVNRTMLPAVSWEILVRASARGSTHQRLSESVGRSPAENEDYQSFRSAWIQQGFYRPGTGHLPQITLSNNLIRVTISILFQLWF